jgi:glycosyltransferase involved in cell wall biosynthesis
LRDTYTLRDKLVLKVKSGFSVWPQLGLVEKPISRPFGVSFVVPVKDEELWVKASLESIKDVADEIIVVDSSVKDNTTKIVQELAKDNPKIRHIRFYLDDHSAFALAVHIGISVVKFKWIFKWDSDIVAKDTASLKMWIDRLKQLNPNKYYVVDVPRINLAVNLTHQNRSVPFGQYEGNIFTSSPNLRCSVKKGVCEQVYWDMLWGHRFPPWYTNLRWHEPFMYHCNIKTPKRIVERRYWTEFMTTPNSGYPTLSEYTAFRVKQETGLTVEQYEAKLNADMLQEADPYDEKRFGPLPLSLQKIALEVPQ